LRRICLVARCRRLLFDTGDISAARRRNGQRIKRRENRQTAENQSIERQATVTGFGVGEAKTGSNNGESGGRHGQNDDEGRTSGSACSWRSAAAKTSAGGHRGKIRRKKSAP
jgi:hypothetical protein